MIETYWLIILGLGAVGFTYRVLRRCPLCTTVPPQPSLAFAVATP